jgi:hypothetical protein
VLDMMLYLSDGFNAVVLLFRLVVTVRSLSFAPKEMNCEYGSANKIA